MVRLPNDELIHGRPDIQEVALLFRASMLIISGQMRLAEDDLKRILMKQNISDDMKFATFLRLGHLNMARNNVKSAEAYMMEAMHVCK